MCERAPHISLGSKICDTCRKKVSKQIPPEVPTSECDTSRVDEVGYAVFSEADSDYIPQDEAISSVNKCLVEIGASPISKKRTHGKNYSKLKLQRITEAMQKVVLTDEIANDGREMIEQLKEKYLVTTERDIRLQILTVLPKSWSVAKVQQEFGVSAYTAQKAKKLVQEKGVLSLPDQKAGPSLLPETVSLVHAHYESDEVSRVMPGKKDFASIRRDGKHVHIQKRLVLSNLKELYQNFKVKFPSLKIGFSKFAELRPKHCVLAGASGTHSVCVCTIHQNVKLMILELRLADLPSYKHALAKIMCNPPSPHCYFGECDACPKTEKLREYLTTSLEENDRDQITYKQWVSTDRSTLETRCAPLEEFVDILCEKLELLRSHSFIASEQAVFYANCKEMLKVGVFLVTADFSENYSFVLQDAAQGFHWNNSQATLHPFVAYYHDSKEVCHLSYVVISDCLHHDTIAVYCFQKMFIAFLRVHLPSQLHPKKIVYFSDGAASQYKNRKNFLNLCHHKDDFDIYAEWHFSATSHGKGACDGLGGTIKRLETIIFIMIKL